MRYIFSLILWMLVLPAFCQDLSIENLLSSPFPSGGVASNSVDKAAWVLNSGGKYNVWIAEGPTHRFRQLTRYTDDDGQAIGDLVFDKTGELIVYVRGGEPNKAKEIPNPSSDPKGAKQQVWAVRTNSGEPVLVGEGFHPDISPDGKTVLFVRDGQIYNAAADGSAKESILIQARGTNDSPRWSPDGSKILFISYRGDHNFVGLYDVQSKRIIWVAPSVDRDFAPVWSADGKRIAFLRFPGGRAEAAKDNEPSSWFSIWVADANSGQGKEVWKSPDRTGGFAQFYPDQPLMWARDDRLVFYWEKDGWIRMYSVNASGGDAIPLTPASCEAETATLSSDRSSLIFSANCNDIERRHLWSVPVKGGKATQLTKGNGIETYPLQPAKSNQLLFVSSTAQQPATPAKIHVSGGEMKLLAPDLIKNFPMEKLIEPQVVVFPASDGLQIHGQLFLPRKIQRNERLPAVIYMHGGPIRQMLPGWHYMSYYHNAYAMNQFLAAKIPKGQRARTGRCDGVPGYCRCGQIPAELENSRLKKDWLVGR